MLLLLFAFLLGAGTGICQAKPKARPHINQVQKDAGFRQLFTSLFSEWDRNRDGTLDLKELNAVIENPQVHGSEAAIAVFLHRHLQVDDEERTNGLALAEALSLANDPAIQKNISGKAWHIEALNHSLFAPGDPNLATFHQGGVGDCYLLAVIGAFVFQHPQSVRGMIAPLAEGKFQVRFGNGKNVIVPPLTDAELIMGGSEGRNHGVWLSVLQKAYAQIDLEAKERKTGRTIAPDEAVTTDFIGHGGYYAPVMVRLTGHKAAGAPLGRWVKQDPQAGSERAHELLARLSSEHRLMAVHTGKDKTKPLPKGIHHGHVFGVLGYNPARRIVVVFNPWGNHLKPAGPPSLIHGYPTEHGIFEMPLSEFIQVFGGLTYETDKPATVAR
jgi:Calpain family cysteine protease